MASRGALEAGLKFIGDLSSISLETEYRSLKDGPVKNFYVPCLRSSTSYKRAVGYFRSSIMLVIGSALVEFARRGGKTLLICSPELKPDDVDIIASGYARRSDLIEATLIEQIDELLASDQTAYTTRILATLVAVGSLEIKLAVRGDRKGLYHEKIGVFSDGLGNRVSFKGSANETWSAWHPDGNFESIEVFCSWRGGLEYSRVEKHESHFDGLWSEKDPDVEVFPFPSNAVEHLKKASYRSLGEVDIEPTSAIHKVREPMLHQKAAIDAWESRGCRGIFKHATGSGKTFTAILVLQKHIDEGRPAIVVVPSQLLLDQWASELRAEIPKAALLLAGGGNNKWKISRRVRSMTASGDGLGGRIILATMQTASTNEFRANIEGGSHLLLVADEVHQIGSAKNSEILSLDAGVRLGLSATPVRYGDPEGTEKIFNYFGEIVPPTVTLFDAIKSRRLVPYEYHPHPITLNAEEADAWRALSNKIRTEIAKQYAQEETSGKLTEKLKMLLIRRARIAKKAAAKCQLARRIISENYQSGDSWLVYCEDYSQLADVIAALRADGFAAVEYHSRMSGDKNATLAWFRSFGGILVSIRCLDEGVDIPAITHALILASSQNPRQFIQRRGRVLRRSSEKQLAVIHDAIVVPTSADDEPEQTGLLKSELLRSIEFASHAINRGSIGELRAIAINLGMDPEAIIDEGIEEDDDD